MPIISIQTGDRLGRVASGIVDPRQLRLVAFYCTGPGIDTNPAILHTEDVREVADVGLIIDSTDDIMPPDDLVRLKEIVQYKFNPIGMQVVDDTRHKLGKVASYSVEVDTFYIMKLHVQPGFLKALQTSEYIIDRSQIVEITSRQIVVRAATSKKEKAEKVLTEALPPIENPFRQRRAQPDGATIEERL